MPRYKPMTPLQRQKLIARNIAILKETLQKYNPGWEDNDYPEDGWEDEVDAMSLEENIDDLEEKYPGVIWRTPDKRVRPDKPVRSKEESFGCGPDGEYDKMEAKVIVKSQTIRAKGKTYTVGRIQLTVNKRFIGSEAEVRIFILGRNPRNSFMPFAT